MTTEIQKTITDTILNLDRELREISLKIHDEPELGNAEFHAHDLLTDYLEKKGFQVTRKAAGLETAFLATYSNSKIGRRVGFVCEYDALPGVGHACGHNIITVQGLASALSIKAVLEKQLAQGTVVLFGTPAEESTGGKINFINTGILKDTVDVAMMLHPFAEDGLYRRMLALNSFTIEFFGKSSHAGAAPWEGVNAVDAIMQGFVNIGLLRQQTLPTNRIHGIITNGGEAANCIPAYSSAMITFRGITKQQVADLQPKVANCFVAAARATGCEYKFTWAPNGPLDDVFMNDTLTTLYKRYMEAEGITFEPRTVEEQTCTGSTDMGNFSYVVPTIHPAYGIHTTAANHTREFTAAARTEVAHKDTLRAAKCQAFTAAEVLVNEQVYQRVVEDFQKGKPQ